MATEAPVVITLEGDFDISSRERFIRMLDECKSHRFAVIDFSRVGYIDSSCFTALIRMRKYRADRGYPPAHLVGIKKLLGRLFEITRLDEVWPFFDTVEEARAAFEKERQRTPS